MHRLMLETFHESLGSSEKTFIYTVYNLKKSM